jgi:hypothetical protein
MPDQSGRSLSRSTTAHGPGRLGRCTGCHYPGSPDATWPWGLCPHNPKTSLTPAMTQPEERTP